MFDFDIYRYEVGLLINNNKNTIVATNDLEVAKNYYHSTINKYNNTNSRVVVFIYDYDNNANIEYYDSEIDIS